VSSARSAVSQSRRLDDSNEGVSTPAGDVVYVRLEPGPVEAAAVLSAARRLPRKGPGVGHDTRRSSTAIFLYLDIFKWGASHPYQVFLKSQIFFKKLFS